LTTLEGRELYILELGVRNIDSGPDFKDGLIILDETLYRGDIEIHPHAKDWYTHQHHLDPAYDRVILHVVTGFCPDDFLTIRSDGKKIQSFNLDSVLDPPAQELEKEYPPAPEIVCELSRQPEPEIFDMVRRFGIRAWDVKCLRFRERVNTESWDQVFWEAFCEALGYGKNQVAFINLSHRCSVERLQTIKASSLQERFDAIATVLLYTAGLLPQKRGAHRESAIDFVQKFHITLLEKSDWKFFRLRPNNFPTCRLLAAAMMFAFYGERFSGYFEVWFREIKTIKDFMSKLQPLVDFHQICIESWLKDLDLEWNVNNSLVGPDRLRSVGYNVIIPFLYEYFRQQNDLKRAALIKNLAGQFPVLSLSRYSRDLLQIIRKEKKEFELWSEMYHQGVLYMAKYLCQPEHCRRCLDFDLARSGTHY
jgi:hypothetical protein